MLLISVKFRIDAFANCVDERVSEHRKSGIQSASSWPARPNFSTDQCAAPISCISRFSIAARSIGRCCAVNNPRQLSAAFGPVSQTSLDSLYPPTTDGPFPIGTGRVMMSIPSTSHRKVNI